MTQDVTTLEAFRATRRHCDNLNEAIDFDYGDGSILTGYIYLDGYFIEDEPDAQRAATHGKYRLILERDEYQSDDLAEIEERLFHYALDEITA